MASPDSTTIDSLIERKRQYDALNALSGPSHQVSSRSSGSANTGGLVEMPEEPLQPLLATEEVVGLQSQSSCRTVRTHTDRDTDGNITEGWQEILCNENTASERTCQFFTKTHFLKEINKHIVEMLAKCTNGWSIHQLYEVNSGGIKTTLGTLAMDPKNTYKDP